MKGNIGQCQNIIRVVLRMKDGRCRAVIEEITYDEDL